LVKAYPLLRAAHLACFGAFEHFRLFRSHALEKNSNSGIRPDLKSGFGFKPDFERLFGQTEKQD
jgi:hypothetical protein